MSRKKCQRRRVKWMGRSVHPQSHPVAWQSGSVNCSLKEKKNSFKHKNAMPCAPKLCTVKGVMIGCASGSIPRGQQIFLRCSILLQPHICLHHRVASSFWQNLVSETSLLAHAFNPIHNELDPHPPHVAQDLFQCAAAPPQ